MKNGAFVDLGVVKNGKGDQLSIEDEKALVSPTSIKNLSIKYILEGRTNVFALLKQMAVRDRIVNQQQ